MTRIPPTRLGKTIEILRRIESGESCSPSSLSNDLKVDERSIQRYIKDLRNNGINIDFDRKLAKYVLQDELKPTTISLQPSELLAMGLLSRTIAEDGQIPFLESAVDGLRRIESALPSSSTDDTAELRESILIKTTPVVPGEDHRDIFNILLQSIEEGRQCKCQYESLKSKDSHPSFIFLPYKLMFNERAWYAIGYHEKRKSIRTLKLARFIKAEITNETFETPNKFNVDKYLGNAWRIIPGDKLHTIILHIKKNLANTITETTWHPSQEFEWHEDGSATITFNVQGLDEIIWWILGLGPECKVIAPQNLAIKIKELADKISCQYTDLPEK